MTRCATSRRRSTRPNDPGCRSSRIGASDSNRRMRCAGPATWRTRRGKTHDEYRTSQRTVCTPRLWLQGEQRTDILQRLLPRASGANGRRRGMRLRSLRLHCRGSIAARRAGLIFSRRLSRPCGQARVWRSSSPAAFSSAQPFSLPPSCAPASPRISSPACASWWPGSAAARP